MYIILGEYCTLHWRHNDHDCVSNHQPYDCLLYRLFRRRSKKTSQLRVTGLCVGNSPGTGEFPAQMASNAKNVSIWWRHHGYFLWYRMVVCIQCILNAVSFPNVANHSTYACQARRVLNNTIVRLVTPTHFCFNLSYQIAHMVIKWKHFLRNWAFVRGIQRSPVNSPYKGQWRGALMFSFICAWINGWENRRETGDWRRHRAHYDVIVMMLCFQLTSLAHNGK